MASPVSPAGRPIAAGEGVASLISMLPLPGRYRGGEPPGDGRGLGGNSLRFPLISRRCLYYRQVLLTNLK